MITQPQGGAQDYHSRDVLQGLQRMYNPHPPTALTTVGNEAYTSFRNTLAASASAHPQSPGQPSSSGQTSNSQSSVFCRFGTARPVQLRWEEQPKLVESEFYKAKELMAWEMPEALPNGRDSFEKYMWALSQRVSKLSLKPTTELANWILAIKDVKGLDHEGAMMRAHHNNHGLAILDKTIANAILGNTTHMNHGNFGGMFRNYHVWCMRQYQNPSGRALLSLLSLAYSQEEDYAAKRLKKEYLFTLKPASYKTRDMRKFVDDVEGAIAQLEDEDLDLERMYHWIYEQVHDWKPMANEFWVADAESDEGIKSVFHTFNWIWTCIHKKLQKQWDKDNLARLKKNNGAPINPLVPTPISANPVVENPKDKKPPKKEKKEKKEDKKDKKDKNKDKTSDKNGTPGKGGGKGKPPPTPPVQKPPDKVDPRSHQPCMYELKKQGSCTKGKQCAYSHNGPLLERYRSIQNPKNTPPPKKNDADPKKAEAKAKAAAEAKKAKEKEDRAKAKAAADAQAKADKDKNPEKGKGKGKDEKGKGKRKDEKKKRQRQR